MTVELLMLLFWILSKMCLLFLQKSSESERVCYPVEQGNMPALTPNFLLLNYEVEEDNFIISFSFQYMYLSLVVFLFAFPKYKYFKSTDTFLLWKRKLCSLEFLSIIAVFWKLQNKLRKGSPYFLWLNIWLGNAVQLSCYWCIISHNLSYILKEKIVVGYWFCLFGFVWFWYPSLVMDLVTVQNVFVNWSPALV